MTHTQKVLIRTLSDGDRVNYSMPYFSDIESRTVSHITHAGTVIRQSGLGISVRFDACDCIARVGHGHDATVRIMPHDTIERVF